MSVLAQWQDDFAAALRTDAVAWPLAAQPAFAVYRNTVWKGWTDALVLNFPAVTALVGEDFMRACTQAYAQTAPPADPTLLRYGEGFETFVATYGPARTLPYLPDIARLDRAWTLAHAAPDAEPLGLDKVAALTPDDTGTLGPVPHPSLSAFWFAETIPTLWLANRDDLEGGALVLEPRPEGLLIVRPQGEVEVMILDAPAYAFVKRCQDGGSLIEAVGAALALDPAVDLGALIGRLLAIGAFARLSPLAGSQS